jgi:alpha-tubulin suppressor-like RCC1 family protein
MHRHLLTVVSVATAFSLLAAAAPANADSLAPEVLVGWGSNGARPDPGRGTLDVPAGRAPGFQQLAGGSYHGLALSAGEVFAWGSNNRKQTDVPAEAMSGVSAVAAGNLTSFALKNGGVIGWGDAGSLAFPIPANVKSGVTAVAAAEDAAFALKNGEVIGWGGSPCNTLEIPTDARSGVQAISARGCTVLALKNGGVTAWGSEPLVRAVPVEARSGVTAVAAGNTWGMALKNGSVIVWGNVRDGRADIPAAGRSGRVTQIAAGKYFAMALVDGKPIVWGNNSDGQHAIAADAASEVTVIGATSDAAFAATTSLKISSPQPVTVGTPANEQLVVGRGTTVIRADGLPGGLGLSEDAQLSGTPAEGTAGAHPVSVTLRNGPVITQRTLTVTVAPAPLTISSPQPVRVGELVHQQLQLSHGASIYSVDGLSGSLDLSSTGLLKGTVPAGSEGTHPVTVHLANGAARAQQTIMLEVLPAGQ